MQSVSNDIPEPSIPAPDGEGPEIKPQQTKRKYRLNRVADALLDKLAENGAQSVINPNVAAAGVAAQALSEAIKAMAPNPEYVDQVKEMSDQLVKATKSITWSFRS